MGPGLRKLITLTVITLSGFYCSWKSRGAGGGGGGGPWGFGQSLFREVLGIVKKSTGGPLFSSFLCFIAFLCDNFSDLTPSPPPPLCGSMNLTIVVISDRKLSVSVSVSAEISVSVCISVSVQIQVSVDHLLSCFQFSLFSIVRWFTYYSEFSACSLLFDCPVLDESCEDCVSGEYSCNIYKGTFV
jgi:hypothetical protein